MHLWSLSGKLSGNPLSCLRILRAEDQVRDEMKSGVSADWRSWILDRGRDLDRISVHRN